MLPVKKCSKNCCKETDTNCARVCVYFGCFVVFIFLNLHAHNESIHRSTCKLNVFYFCKNVLSQLECIQTFTIFTISIRQWNFWVERSMCFYANIFACFLISRIFSYPTANVLVYPNACFILIASNYFNLNLLTYLKICCTGNLRALLIVKTKAKSWK